MTTTDTQTAEAHGGRIVHALAIGDTVQVLGIGTVATVKCASAQQAIAVARFYNAVAFPS